MRKIVALATLIALVATLIVPTVAVARGGPPAGKGPGFTPPGQAKKAAPSEASVAEEADEPADEAPSPDSKEARKAEKAEGKAAAKAEKAAARSVSEGAELSSLDESATPDPDEADEPSDTGKMFGIANALSRIMANIERAEARVAAGQKSHVPTGLLNVLSKFLGWLGIDAEPESDVDEPDVTDPGDEGSDEETSTPLPDGSEEDTVTTEPEFEE